jgi:hypothetical protein
MEDNIHRSLYQRLGVVARLDRPLVTHICDQGGCVLKQLFQVHKLRTDVRLFCWFARALLDRREHAPLSSEGATR